MSEFRCFGWARIWCFVVLAVFAGISAGCGGSLSTGSRGEVSGLVTDVQGVPVSGARVFSGDRQTTTNSAGSYVLTGVPIGIRTIQAEFRDGALRFTGRNVVRVFEADRSKSTNITLVRDTQQAVIRGTVRTSSGLRVQGARVAANFGTFSSSMALTDANGDYEIRALAAGIEYELIASAAGFNSDIGSVVLSPRENRRVDFTLRSPTDPLIPAPANLTAVAWTSPKEVTRSHQDQLAFEGIKREFDPRRAEARASSRSTILGNFIEVNLYWDRPPVQFDDNLLGYGIYRATTSTGLSAAVDFLRDPIATFYQDLDSRLREDRNYYYEITALNTRFLDNTGNSESDFSNRYGVRTLGDLTLRTPLQGPLTFRWNPAIGATEYIVYLYDRYPGIGVTSIWSNAATRTSNTQLVYSGPSLIPGRTYYYVVLGVANGDDSRTISPIDSFVAN